MWPWLAAVISGNVIQNLTYSFNKLGNLTRRADGEFGSHPLTETISYDDLNRLTESLTTQSGTDQHHQGLCHHHLRLWA